MVSENLISLIIILMVAWPDALAKKETQEPTQLVEDAKNKAQEKRCLINPKQCPVVDQTSTETPQVIEPKNNADLKDKDEKPPKTEDRNPPKGSNMSPLCEGMATDECGICAVPGGDGLQLLAPSQKPCNLQIQSVAPKRFKLNADKSIHVSFRGSPKLSGTAAQNVEVNCSLVGETYIQSTVPLITMEVTAKKNNRLEGVRLIVGAQMVANGRYKVYCDLRISSFVTISTDTADNIFDITVEDSTISTTIVAPTTEPVVTTTMVETTTTPTVVTTTTTPTVATTTMVETTTTPTVATTTMVETTTTPTVATKTMVDETPTTPTVATTTMVESTTTPTVPTTLEVTMEASTTLSESTTEVHPLEQSQNTAFAESTTSPTVDSTVGIESTPMSTTSSTVLVSSAPITSPETESTSQQTTDTLYEQSSTASYVQQTTNPNMVPVFTTTRADDTTPNSATEHSSTATSLEESSTPNEKFHPTTGETVQTSTKSDVGSTTDATKPSTSTTASATTERISTTDEVSPVPSTNAPPEPTKENKLSPLCEGMLDDVCELCEESSFRLPFYKAQACKLDMKSIHPRIINVNNDQLITVTFSGSPELSESAADNIDVTCSLHQQGSLVPIATFVTHRIDFEEQKLLGVVLKTGEQRIPASKYKLVCKFRISSSHSVSSDKVTEIEAYDFAHAFELRILASSLKDKETKSHCQLRVKADFPNLLQDGKSYVCQYFPANFSSIVASSVVSSDQGVVECILEMKKHRSELTQLFVYPDSQDWRLEDVLKYQKPIDIDYEEWIIQNPECGQFTQVTTKPIIQRKLRIVSTRFSGSFTAVQIKFNVNVHGLTDCAKLFDPLTLVKFGNCTCDFNTNLLVVTLGDDATIVPKDEIVLHHAWLRSKDQPLILESIDPDGQNRSMVQEGDFPERLQLAMPAVKPFPVVKVKSANAIRTRCDSTLLIKLQAMSGDAHRQLIYNWSMFAEDQASDQRIAPDVPDSVRKMMSAHHSDTLEMNKDLIASRAQQYTFKVTACNFLAECSDLDPIPIQIVEGSESFTVGILGLDGRHLPGRRVKLFASPSYRVCGKTFVPMLDAQFTWSVNGSVQSRESVLRIAPYSFHPNAVVFIELFASFKTSANLTLAANYSGTLHYDSEQLQLIFSSSRQLVGSGYPLVLDASRSHDPNKKQPYNVNHRWTCRYMNATEFDNQSCIFGNTTEFNSLLLGDRSITVKTEDLKPGHYEFTDTISSNGQSASGTTRVVIENHQLPELKLLPLAQSTIDISKPAKFNVYIQYTDRLNISYHFADADGFGSVGHRFDSVMLPIEMFEMGFFIYSFTIHTDARGESILAHDTNYRLVVQGRNDAGWMSEAELDFLTNSPPRPGTFEVSPTSGIVALTTHITLAVGPGWTDNVMHYPFTYQFGLRTHSVNNHEDQWWPSSTADSVTICLPSAWPGRHAVCGWRTAFQGLLRVCDRLLACTDVEGPLLRVSFAHNTQAAINALSGQAEQDILSGNSLSAYVKLLAIQGEQCNTLDESLALQTSDKVLSNVNAHSDRDELRDALLQASDLLTTVKNISQADTTFSHLEHVLSLFLGLSQRSGVQNRTRGKRGTETNVVDVAVADADDDAATLLKLLVRRLQRGEVDSFLEGIEDYISEAMCLNRDITQGKMINVLHPVQVEVVVDRLQTERDYSVSDVRVSVDSSIVELYSAFECQTGVMCDDVCLSGTRIMRNNFTVDRQPHGIVSDMFLVQLINRLSGKALPIDGKVTLTLPVKNVDLRKYYSCWLYDVAESIWTNASCSFQVGQIGSGGTIVCDCDRTGYIVISSSALSTGSRYHFAPHREIRVTMALQNATSSCETLEEQILTELSSAVRIAESRLHSPVCSAHGQSFTLTVRPASTMSDLSSGALVDQLEHSLYMHGRSGLHLSIANNGTKSFTIVFAVQPVVASESIRLDAEGEQVSYGIALLVPDQLQNYTDEDFKELIPLWIARIVGAAHITESRIFDFKVVPATNPGDHYIAFVVLPPEVEGENDDQVLSVGEVVQIIKERLHYGELNLVSIDDGHLKLDPNRTIVERLEPEEIAVLNGLSIAVLVFFGMMFLGTGLLIFVLIYIKKHPEKWHKLREEKDTMMRPLFIEEVADVMPNGMAAPKMRMKTVKAHSAPNSAGSSSSSANGTRRYKKNEKLRKQKSDKDNVDSDPTTTRY